MHDYKIGFFRLAYSLNLSYKTILSEKRFNIKNHNNNKYSIFILDNTCSIIASKNYVNDVIEQ